MKVSVLIPTRNRSGSLKRTLEHLAQQTLAKASWEAIVVDNGSSDGTARILSEASANLPLVALSEHQPGKNRALNRALEIAKGDLLAFTDDDVVPDRVWLSELVDAAERLPQFSIFGGRIVPVFPDGTRSWLPTHPWARVWAFTEFAPHLPEGALPDTPCGPNFAVRASAMRGLRCAEQVGPRGENYAMGGETELINRLTARGERCAYVPSAVVSHVIEHRQVSLTWLQKRAFLAGRGSARCGSEDRSPTRFGAPRSLWSDLVRSGLRYLLTRDERGHFDAGIQFNIVRGKIHERRLMAREADR